MPIHRTRRLARVATITAAAIALVAAAVTVAALAARDAGATGSGPGLYGWGATLNWKGQTGNGQGGGSTGPYPVVGMAPTSDVVAVAAGGSHSLVLAADGAVYGFGANQFGELGTAGRNINVPTPVPGLGSGVTRIAAGGSHSLALKDDGTVLAWGLNSHGELGVGNTDSQSQPSPVAGLGAGSGVVAIAAGYQHSLALKADGTVLAWGDNAVGQLGNATTISSTTPVAVSGLGPGSGVVEVATGLFHSLARASTGDVFAWGTGERGALGQGVFGSSSVPVAVVGLPAGGATKIDGGGNYSAAIGADGSVLMWGDGSIGRRCDTNTAPVDVATVVPTFPPGTGIADLALGWQNTLVVRADGAAFGCGYNQDNVLGNGNGGVGPDGAAFELLPSPVLGLGAGSGTTDVDTGFAHSLGIAAAPTAQGTVVITTTTSTTTGSTTTSTTTTPPEPAVYEVSLGAVTIEEGDAGTRTAYVPLTLDEPAPVAIAVTLRTRPDPANTSDYKNVSQKTVTFAAGSRSKTVAIPVYGDAATEDDNLGFVDVVGVTNATIADGQGELVVSGDDPSLLPGVLVSASDVAITESDQGTLTASFTVTLNRAATSDVTVRYSTQSIAAFAGSDFKAKSGTLTFKAGQVSKPVAITINPDRTSEGDEVFLLNLSNPSGAALFKTAGVGTIVDND